jgi:DNA repair protein RadA/Sms
MARDGATYVCQSCGAAQSRWSGQCPACGTWNTLVEESGLKPPGALSASRATRVRGLDFQGLAGEIQALPRIQTGIEEFDRVCGGGVARGSALLVGGDPGVGKSTLLMQAVSAAAMRGAACAYVSGEESVDQIRSRAQRMGLGAAPVQLAAETSLRNVLDGLKRSKSTWLPQGPRWHFGVCQFNGTSAGAITVSAGLTCVTASSCWLISVSLIKWSMI